MGAPKVAFAVSSGSYSDYSVHAVCEDEATAERWAEALRSDSEGWHSDAVVEELPLIAAGTKPAKQTTVHLSQTLWDDGHEEERHVSETSEYPIVSLYGPPPRRPSVRFVRAPIHKNRGGRLEIRGRTESAVLKVYGDEIRMWRANPVAYRREETP
jgi:hypothetical protein